MTDPAPDARFDHAKAAAFRDRVGSDLTAALISAMTVLGDRLGLFRDLATNGPATSTELAARAGVHERYAREWLSALASAAYLTYDRTTQRFALPPEHAATLAHEHDPAFVGGLFQCLGAELVLLDRIADAFRHGGGVPNAAYGEQLWDGIERISAGAFDGLLVQHWIAAIPDLAAALQRGIDVADIGCGRGRALIRLAQAFPAGRYVGFDAFAPTIARATANAEAAGVADRVRFVAVDAASGLPDAYDLITTFDVVHDAPDPLALLHAIRAALRPSGVYLCQDANCSERLEENLNPLGATQYSVSVLYCLTQSLAAGGAGLGTFGLPEPRLRALCAEAGFGTVRRLPLDNPFSNVYEVRP